MIMLAFAACLALAAVVPPAAAMMDTGRPPFPRKEELASARGRCIKAADENLYKAKAGRNRVVASEAEAPTGATLRW